MRCLLCDDPVVEGSKSFGTIGGHLCSSCYFAFPDSPSLEEQNKQFREAFSQPSDAKKPAK